MTDAMSLNGCIISQPFQLLEMGWLLEIDAQVQFLIELAETLKSNFEDEFGLSEEEIIKMIKSNKNSFYRELTGYTNKDNPTWSLICLSEDLLSD